MTPSRFLAESTQYVAAFDAWAQQYSPNAKADHICFKCGDTAEFEHVRAIFEAESAFIYQSIIAKRRIALVKFLVPIHTVLGEISLLELSDQKPDGSQTSGFDHIEIYPTAGSIEDFVANLEANGAHFEKIVRPHHTTFDATILDDFKIRIEPEPLLEKIKMTEMF